MNKCFCWFFLCLPVMAGAGERIYVQTPAVYGEGSAVRQGIKSECSIDLMLTDDLLLALKARNPETLPLPMASPDPSYTVLKLTILDAEGYGGGGWSGAKSITVRAEMFRNGQLVRSIDKRAHSRMGSFGYMSGVCSIFENVSKSLSKHLVRWALQPIPAALGSVDGSVSGE